MPDYVFLLESRLTPDQRRVVSRLQGLAQQMEVNIYLVGGAIRDLICGQPIRDLDFAVEGNALRMVKELEPEEFESAETDENLRSAEILFRSGVLAEVSSARSEIFPRPGDKPEIRPGSIFDDLRRRDFSVNAIALSLNPASRGLLLDPTNGLADIEKREIRTLTTHSFTNDPSRILRIIRFSTRLGFKPDERTSGLLDIAIERRLHGTISGQSLGREMKELAREANPIAVLKKWEERGVISALHPNLARRHPDYAGLAQLIKMRDLLADRGWRANLCAPVMHYVLRRLKGRERSTAVRNFGLRSAEVAELFDLEDEARRVAKMLLGRKTLLLRPCYQYLETVPIGLLTFVLCEFGQVKVQRKIRNHLLKQRLFERELPVAELEGYGIPRGPKFDQILKEFFFQALETKTRSKNKQSKLLRRIAGVPEPKKVRKPPPKAKEKAKPKAKAAAQSAAGAKATRAPVAPPAAVTLPARLAGEQQAKPQAAPARRARVGRAKSKPKPAAHKRRKEARKQGSKERAHRKTKPATHKAKARRSPTGDRTKQTRLGKRPQKPKKRR